MNEVQRLQEVKRIMNLEELTRDDMRLFLNLITEGEIERKIKLKKDKLNAIS